MSAPLPARGAAASPPSRPLRRPGGRPASPPPPAAQWICLGAFAGAHGLAGLVRVRPFTAVPGAVAAYGPVRDEAAGRSFRLRCIRPASGGQILVRVQGVDRREDVEALKGVRFGVDRDRLPPAPADEFYHADLIGLAVTDTGGRPLGRVRAMLDFGAGDLVEIALSGRGGRKAMILPFNRDTVPDIDMARRVMVVDPPPAFRA